MGAALAAEGRLLRHARLPLGACTHSRVLPAAATRKCVDDGAEVPALADAVGERPVDSRSSSGACAKDAPPALVSAQRSVPFGYRARSTLLEAPK